MSAPGSWARIEFPARFLDDDIKKELADYYGDSENGEPDIEAGIFTLEDGEARCGEFEELEAMLKTKGIPFDRETAMDWQQPPCRQIYRPARDGQAEVDEHIQLNDDGEVVVNVEAIRLKLAMIRQGISYREGILMTVDECNNALKHIDLLLDTASPTYPPLTDWVKEG